MTLALAGIKLLTNEEMLPLAPLFQLTIREEEFRLSQEWQQNDGDANMKSEAGLKFLTERHPETRLKPTIQGHRL